MLFVDTGAWFALSVPSDSDHSAAKGFLEQNHEPLVTTDYVVDELLTLFRMRQQKHRAELWLQQVLFQGGVALVMVETVDFHRALEIYRTYQDKRWSFTDCTSFAVIERLKISKAFAFDEHFLQFGSVVVLP